MFLSSKRPVLRFSWFNSSRISFSWSVTLMNQFNNMLSTIFIEHNLPSMSMGEVVLALMDIEQKMK